MFARSHFASAGAVLLLTVTLAGCSGAGGASSSTQPSTHPKPSPSASDETIVLPLDEYVPSGPTEAGAAKLAELDDAIAQCMGEQGFEYTPAKPLVLPADAKKDPGTMLPPRNWVAEHGSGRVEGAFLPVDYKPDTDANTEYVATLSASQKEAYDRALMGKAVDSNVDQLRWDEKGCTGKASHEVDPGREKPRPSILDDITDFKTALWSEPEIVALDKEWAACMSEAGFPDETAQRKAGFGIGAEIGAYVNAHGLGPTRDDPKYAELLKQDIAIGLANWDCSDAMDYGTRVMKVEYAREKTFVAEHKSELDEAKIWMNG